MSTPIIQVRPSSTFPQIHYLSATNESDTALIIVPDVGQNVNAGLQILILNNEFPSWAFDWSIVPNAQLTLPDYAEIFAAWLRELAFCQYQIVGRGQLLVWLLLSFKLTGCIHKELLFWILVYTSTTIICRRAPLLLMKH